MFDPFDPDDIDSEPEQQDDEEDGKNDNKEDDQKCGLFSTQIGMDTSDCINTFDLKLHKSRDERHHILLEGLMIDSYEKKRYKMIPITEISIAKINIEDRYKNVVEEVCDGFWI